MLDYNYILNLLGKSIARKLDSKILPANKIYSPILNRYFKSVRISFRVYSRMEFSKR